MCVSAIVTDTRAAGVSRPARGYLLQPTFPNFINEGQSFHKYVLTLSDSLLYMNVILETENLFLLMHMVAIPRGICAAFSVNECYGQGISLFNLCSEIDNCKNCQPVCRD